MLNSIRTEIARTLEGDQLIDALSRHLPGAERHRLRPLAAVIEPFLLGMPDALAFLIRAGRDEKVGRAVQLASGQVAQYVLDDRDLLPEAEYGVLGLLDDALLVHHQASQVLAWYPWTDAVA